MAIANRLKDGSKNRMIPRELIELKSVGSFYKKELITIEQQSTCRSQTLVLGKFY